MRARPASCPRRGARRLRATADRRWRCNRRSAGDESARAVGLHQETGGAAAYFQALSLLARGGVDNQHVGAGERGNENQLSVRRELQTVRSFYVRVQGGDRFLSGEIQNRDRSVLRVGGPDLL